MSWAAKRVTTRIEGQAYSMIGLSAVNMPLLYGEGERAFHRLHGEIIKDSQDLSTLAWRHTSKYRLDRRELFAASPKDFSDCNGMHRASQRERVVDTDTRDSTVMITNIGLRVENPLIARSTDGPHNHNFALILGCWNESDITKSLR